MRFVLCPPLDLPLPQQPSVVIAELKHTALLADAELCQQPEVQIKINKKWSPNLEAEKKSCNLAFRQGGRWGTVSYSQSAPDSPCDWGESLPKVSPSNVLSALQGMVMLLKALAKLH